MAKFRMQYQMEVSSPQERGTRRQSFSKSSQPSVSPSKAVSKKRRPPHPRHGKAARFAPSSSPRRQTPPSSTAWHDFGKWYDGIVGQQGHFYHQTVVLPGVLGLLDLKPSDHLLDLACGQGVLAHVLPAETSYVGIDASLHLIEKAKERAQHKKKLVFKTADISSKLPLLEEEKFDAITIILALQNIERQDQVIAHLTPHLKKGGKLVIVLNHPCFRIPRQSHWSVDESCDLQYRRIQRYMSPLSVPMQVNPSKKEQSRQMWAFHQPLSFYFQCFAQNGLSVLKMEEWISPKTSQGKAAKRENRARKEFPLFLAFLVSPTPSLS